jgi:hypothetical protein
MSISRLFSLLMKDRSLLTDPGAFSTMAQRSPGGE